MIRGGYGLFFTQLEADAAHQSQLQIEHVSLTVLNDGRPDFAVNPFNGPAPTYEQVLATACDINGNRPGCLRRSVANEIPFGDHDTSFSHMASVGVQRQFGAVMSIESNYVLTGGRKEEFAPNINLTYNPATGANLRFQDTALTPFPDWGIVRAEIMTKRSNYYGWENTLHEAVREPVAGERDVYAGVVQGRGAESVHRRAAAGAADSDRSDPAGVPGGGGHWRACMGWRRRTSGTGRRSTGSGTGCGLPVERAVLLRLGGTVQHELGRRPAEHGRQRARAGCGRMGSSTPRNNLVGEPIHRVDMRLTKRQRIVGRMTIDGMVEVFNLFNHENFGSYTTLESNAAYGQPSFNANVAYQPRIVQFGFRFAF